MKKFNHYSVFFGKKERKFSNYVEAEKIFNIVSKNIKKCSLYIFLDSENKVMLKENKH